MANEEHLAILSQGAEAWNAWRREHASVRPDLGGANLIEVDLSRANLRQADLLGADLSRAHLRGANLIEADLSGADLLGARLRGADLGGAHLRGADLRGAYLGEARLGGADLSKADLGGAHLRGADLCMAQLGRANFRGADFSGANLVRANLSGANLGGVRLNGANLSGANLAGVNLQEAVLVETNLAAADLTGCRIYGLSAWGLDLQGTTQKDLIITRDDEPEVTVDNLEVAQFIYLLLHNEKIRDVIDTITTKAVLILGRFTPERKAVLDALREELRKRDRTPIVFDFDQPENKNITDTVKLLAQMARYIIVDLSDPNSAPYELGVISMLGLDSTPVVPLIAGGQRPFPMLADVLQKRWSTQLVRYQDLDDIRANLDGMLIKVAEAKVQELRGVQQATT